MARYLFIASYTDDGLRQLLTGGGTGVIDPIAELRTRFQIEHKPDDFFFALGEDDVYIPWELPDNETAATISLAMTAAGALRVRTIMGLEPEALDRVAERIRP